jgi:hypothetical protein
MILYVQRREYHRDRTANPGIHIGEVDEVFSVRKPGVTEIECIDGDDGCIILGLGVTSDGGWSKVLNDLVDLVTTNAGDKGQ